MTNNAPVSVKPVAARTGVGPGRPCTVCAHPQRAEIDQALIAGEGFRPIAAHFGLTKQAITRHRDNHVPTPAMLSGAEAVAEAEGNHGAGLVQSATNLRDKALTLLQKAESAGDLRTALMGVREAARCLELMAKLTGELDESVHLNILVSPALVALQQTILRALAQYPEARAAVVLALGNVGSGAAMIEG